MYDCIQIVHCNEYLVSTVDTDAWYFSTRAVVVPLLITYPCASSRLWVNSLMMGKLFNTSRLRQNGRHFPDGIFKWIFLNENVRSSIKISLKFVPGGPISNIPALVQIMVWRRPGDKPLSESMRVSLLTHICITRPQWVKRFEKTMPAKYVNVYVFGLAVSVFKKAFH